MVDGTLDTFLKSESLVSSGYDNDYFFCLPFVSEKIHIFIEKM
jgi:hypothetical protein